MKLSRVERWILANQYRILEALYPKDAKTLGKNREAIECGYEAHYDEIASSIYGDDAVVSEDDSHEVIEILQMFRSLKLAPDKGAADERSITFDGFDGNAEIGQMAYAKYFCGLDGGRFSDIGSGSDDFDSHGPSLDTYRRQLDEWRLSADKNHLSKDEVERIAKAAIHPNYR